MKRFSFFLTSLLMACQAEERDVPMPIATPLPIEHLRQESEYPATPVLFPEAPYLYFTNPRATPCSYDMLIWTGKPDSMLKIKVMN